MPITRVAGADTSSCQHVVSAVNNVVLDVEACAPQAEAVTGASDIVARMTSNIPHAG
jgi:hypothetical protein